MTVFRLTLALLERPLHPFHSGGCRGTVGTRRWGENYKLVQKRKSGKWRKCYWIFLWGQTGLLKSMGDARRNQTYRPRVTSDEETPVLVTMLSALSVIWGTKSGVIFLCGSPKDFRVRLQSEIQWRNESSFFFSFIGFFSAVLYFTEVLRKLYFTLAFPFSAVLYVHTTTFQREVLY